MLTVNQITAELFAAESASTCLELLAETRRAIGFSIVGFRETVGRPVVNQLADPDGWTQRFGWPEGFKQGWVREGHAKHFPHTGRFEGAHPVCHWTLPQHDDAPGSQDLTPQEQEAVQYMRRFGITAGMTIRVRRPFGETGCVAWMLPENHFAPSTLEPLFRAARRLSGQFFESFDHCCGWRDGSPLSPRGIECLTLAAQGMSDKLIARAIGKSVETVRFHMKSAIRQLNAVNRTHAVAIGIRDGLIAPPGGPSQRN